MGLGYRYFFGPWQDGWMDKGFQCYFGNEEKMDSYRACEVLYGNGGYLFFYPTLSKSQALTECLTVGVAQRHYALQQVDYVRYGRSGQWWTLEAILPASKSLQDVQSWFTQFHIRYKNGCHVWVNRSANDMDVQAPGNVMLKLPQNGWAVYTEDGNLLTYTAVVDDPIVAGHKRRVDYSRDKARGIEYINPRGVSEFKGTAKPTLLLNGIKTFVLEDPAGTFESNK